MKYDLKKALNIIATFYYDMEKEELDERERSIILGSLENLTYPEMMEKYRSLTYYSVQFIAKNTAFQLWKKLSQSTLKSDSSYLKPEFKVRKKNLWLLVDRIIKSESRDNSIEVDIPGSEIVGKVLLGRFELEEYLYDCDRGESQFLALDRHFHNKHCLVIQRSHQTNRVRKQFEREGEVLEKIGKHDQIPQLLAHFRENQHLYSVYEYISGEALVELITNEPWQEAKVKSLLLGLLEVLRFVQEHNYIHRNINPANIVRVNKQWFLTDFATMKEILPDKQNVTHSTLARVDKSYQAPEQCTGMATFASDIFSLGIIAVQALTGVHPRQLKIDPHTGNKIWQNQALVSDAFARVINRATSFHFRDRYQSATEMLKNLSSL